MRIQLKLKFPLVVIAWLFAGLISSGQAKDMQHDPRSFEWKPELSPQGAVTIVVSLSRQEALVYRNGVRIGRCLVSTGKKGYETPTGIFHILNKDKDHRSKTYNNAPMPYSERLTWDGVALHAGGLPGYPESHGCIHLPYEFSKLLFGVTQKGVTVVVTKDYAEAYVTNNHGAPVSGHRPNQFQNNVSWMWTPEKSPSGPVSVLVSETDKKIYVLRNGVPIGESPIAVTRSGRKFSGTQAFSLLNRGNGAVHSPDGKLSAKWMRIGGTQGMHAEPLTDFFHIPPGFARELDTLLHPGSIVVVTSEAVTKQSKSNPGFTILASQALRKADGKQ
ncbi:MAG: L,D-transpeptidase family protein [Verrucomicrobiales bacterium]|nr:L,D-transpeptidase family protein [Verrucomicrobiales bacterium]